MGEEALIMLVFAARRCFVVQFAAHDRFLAC
jgi:hypothetical protein